ncbi:hypothetical protein HYS54_00435 [Candidatus Micrarchaeota archaeon]|nr:hypothetical protein [Candidatus Micrarchaeota archaeon]
MVKTVTPCGPAPQPGGPIPAAGVSNGPGGGNCGPRTGREAGPCPDPALPGGLFLPCLTPDGGNGNPPPFCP